MSNSQSETKFQRFTVLSEIEGHNPPIEDSMSIESGTHEQHLISQYFSKMSDSKYISNTMLTDGKESVTSGPSPNKIQKRLSYIRTNKSETSRKVSLKSRPKSVGRIVLPDSDPLKRENVALKREVKELKNELKSLKKELSKLEIKYKRETFNVKSKERALEFERSKSFIKVNNKLTKIYCSKKDLTDSEYIEIDFQNRQHINKLISSLTKENNRLTEFETKIYSLSKNMDIYNKGLKKVIQRLETKSAVEEGVLTDLFSKVEQSLQVKDEEYRILLENKEKSIEDLKRHLTRTKPKFKRFITEDNKKPNDRDYFMNIK